MDSVTPDVQVLIDAVKMKMPFGKYKGSVICDLPVHYLEWLYRKGFPAGKLGMVLSTVYEVKINGLAGLLLKVKQKVAEAETK